MDESTGKKDGLFNIAIGNGPFVDGLPNLRGGVALRLHSNLLE